MATANHVLLRRITLTADASSVTFDSIPQTGYTDLKLQYSVRGTATPAYLYEHIRMSFNGGSSGDYRSKMLYGNGSSAYSADGSGPGSSYAPWAGVFSSNNTTSNTFSSCETYITNYAVAGVEKSFSTDAVSENNATGAAATLTAQRWTGTAAINSITIAASTGNFMAGSSFSLYGIAELNTIPTAAPKADGGDIIKTDGTYWYHAFTGSGIFKPQLNLTADILQIAGGGGAGGFAELGAGGAGGLLGFTAQALTSGSSYVCTVGAGGASGANDWYSLGVQGGNSQFGSLTASVGGGGGRSYNANDNISLYVGGTGGSGGGGGARYGNPGNGVSGQGNRGGYASYSVGGGGGGAGGVGANGDSGAHGGVGSSAYSSWGAATSLGQNVSGTYYFAGGGAAQSGTGGNGGGGNSGVAGTAATGGGGGGSYSNGKAGGSGVIIIRYPV